MQLSLLLNYINSYEYDCALIKGKNQAQNYYIISDIFVKPFVLKIFMFSGNKYKV